MVKYTTENTLQKAWRCARVLSEFYYDYISYGIINKWDDVAGSVTTNEDRKTYFINTLGYTESEYITLHDGLLGNKKMPMSITILLTLRICNMLWPHASRIL